MTATPIRKSLFDSLQPPRVDWARVNREPTAEDLAEMPATTGKDWEDAELVRMVEPGLFRAIARMLDNGEITPDPEGGPKQAAI